MCTYAKNCNTFMQRTAIHLGKELQYNCARNCDAFMQRNTIQLILCRYIWYIGNENSLMRPNISLSGIMSYMYMLLVTSDRVFYLTHCMLKSVMISLSVEFSKNGFRKTMYHQIVISNAGIQ